MTHLLDTNALSEWVKPAPDAGLVSWLDEVDEDRTYLSVISLGELRAGVDRLAPGKRRDRLAQWLTVDLPDRFEGRLLAVDEEVADMWGRLLARATAAGSPITGADGLIAATAAVHGLTVVTRDVTPFRTAGLPVECPWEG